MRYLIDSNIFVYLATDVGLLSNDVYDCLNEPDTILCMSSASAMELVVGFNNKSFDVKRWRSAEEMIHSIRDDYFIEILPFKEEHLMTFARLRTNQAKGHVVAPRQDDVPEGFQVDGLLVLGYQCAVLDFIAFAAKLCHMLNSRGDED